MTYQQLRAFLPAESTIPTLGGRTEIELINPSFGNLTIINFKGNCYLITESDWQNACAICKRNPHNPWRSSHYCDLSSYYSYGLVHAAAILRYISEYDDVAA